MTCGIYAIVCNKTWRAYVGQTKNLETRFQDHTQLLKRNNHSNSELQKDFDLYGESSFFYETIEEVEEIKLGIRESYWINSSVNLYNKTNSSRTIILTEEEKVRFWKWVDIKSADECWLWTGAKDTDGYGRIGYFREGKKRMFRSNRLAHFLVNPEDDVNLVVRHKCHKPECCNPNHLLIGTNGDNKRDLLDKENNHYILNWDIVNCLREKFKENPNAKPKELINWVKDTFNIDFNGNGHIVRICLNEMWYDENYHPPERILRYYLTEEDISLIRKYSKNNTPINCFKKVNKINSKIPKSNCLRTIRLINKGEI